MAPKYDEGEDMVRQLQANQTGVDAKLQQAQIQLFKNQKLIHSGDGLDPTAEGGEEQDDSDAEDSGSEESESDSEAAESGSGSDEDEDVDEEDAGGAGLRSTPQETSEVRLVHCKFVWGLHWGPFFVCWVCMRPLVWVCMRGLLGSPRGVCLGLPWSA